jgi:hypothetical protein
VEEGVAEQTAGSETETRVRLEFAKKLKQE